MGPLLRTVLQLQYSTASNTMHGLTSRLTVVQNKPLRCIAAEILPMTKSYSQIYRNDCLSTFLCLYLHQDLYIRAKKVELPSFANFCQQIMPSKCWETTTGYRQNKNTILHTSLYNI